MAEMICTDYARLLARVFVFGILLCAPVSPVVASTPAPYPYEAHFAEADHVYVARCVTTKALGNEETRSGTTIHRMSASLQRRATFKGAVKDEFLEIGYSEVEITKPAKVRELDPMVLESLTWAIANQPIFEPLKTYLVFMNGKQLISAIEVPDRQRP